MYSLLQRWSQKSNCKQVMIIRITLRSSLVSFGKFYSESFRYQQWIDSHKHRGVTLKISAASSQTLQSLLVSQTWNLIYSVQFR